MAQIDLVAHQDYQELARFLADFEDDGRDQQFWMNHFRFWWDENPALDSEIPRGWIVRDRRIGGFLGNVPTFFQLGGQEVVVHNSTTWRVADDCRQLSLALFERLIRQSKSRILLNTTPIDSVAKIMQAMSFKLLPRKSFSVGFAIFDFDSFLHSRINNRLVRTTLALAAHAVTRLRRWERCRVGSELRIVEVKRADDSFDELWMRTRHQYAHTNVRTARDLNWFCFNNQNIPKLILAAYDGAMLVGFITLKRFKAFDRTKDRLECLDLWVDKKAQDVTLGLMRATVELANERSLESVQFPCFNEEMVRGCQQLGLFMRLAKPARDYAKIPLENINAVREDNSYFVISQGDYGYF